MKLLIATFTLLTAGELELSRRLRWCVESAARGIHVASGHALYKRTAIIASARLAPILLREKGVNCNGVCTFTNRATSSRAFFRHF